MTFIRVIIKVSQSVHVSLDFHFKFKVKNYIFLKFITRLEMYYTNDARPQILSNS